MKSLTFDSRNMNDDKSRLQLDAITLRNLEILQNNDTHVIYLGVNLSLISQQRQGSLLDKLDHCCTGMGTCLSPSSVIELRQTTPPEMVAASASRFLSHPNAAEGGQVSL